MSALTYRESLFLCKALGVLYHLTKILWSPYRLMNYLPSVFQPYYAATLSVPFVRTCVNRFSHFTWYI